MQMKRQETRDKKKSAKRASYCHKKEQQNAT